MIAPSQVVAAPAAAPAAISPVAGRRYRLTSEDVRDSGTLRRRFVQTTELVFRPEPGGWIVESTLVELHAEPAGDDAATRFLIGEGGLKGRTVRLHLDPAGRLRSIDDEEAAWTALMTGVAAMGDRRPEQRLPIARDPSAPLRALAPPARRALIATAARLAVPARPLPGTRAITLAGAMPGDAALPGTETVIDAAGRISDQTRAFLADGDNAQSVDRDRVIDAASGLLIRTVETRTMRIGDRIRTARRTDTLAAVP